MNNNLPALNSVLALNFNKKIIIATNARYYIDGRLERHLFETAPSVVANPLFVYEHVLQQVNMRMLRVPPSKTSALRQSPGSLGRLRNTNTIYLNVFLRHFCSLAVSRSLISTLQQRRFSETQNCSILIRCDGRRTASQLFLQATAVQRLEI